MIPKHALVRKIQIPPGIRLEKEPLVESIPESLRRWLLKSANETPGTIQLYFLIKTERYSFLITAVYFFGKHIEVVIQKEDTIAAPFCTVKAFYCGVVNSIQDHINGLIEAEKLIIEINKGNNESKG